MDASAAFKLAADDRPSDSLSRRGIRLGRTRDGTEIDSVCRMLRPWTCRSQRPPTQDGFSVTCQVPGKANSSKESRIVFSMSETSERSLIPSTRIVHRFIRRESASKLPSRCQTSGAGKSRQHSRYVLGDSTRPGAGVPLRNQMDQFETYKTLVGLGGQSVKARDKRSAQ